MSVQKKERNQLRVCHFFAYEQSKIYEHYMGKIINSVLNLRINNMALHSTNLKLKLRSLLIQPLYTS